MKENKGKNGYYPILRTKFKLSSVVISCSVFFFLGFFGSSFLSQNKPEADYRSRSRVLEVVKNRYNPMPHGKSGDAATSLIPFQVLSWKPRALYFPNFATPEQCRRIIGMAKSQLVPSRLALREGETVESTKGTRTSSGAFIRSAEDKTGLLELIEEKIASVTMIPKENGEAFNILRYEIGQKYDSHYDVFSAAEYGPQDSQRVATFLLYLSDVEEGAETMFPFENDQNIGTGYDYKKCIGLRVKPRLGDGLLFHSVFANGTIDKASLHGSCPVIKGEKWVATKWLRDKFQEDYVL